MPKTVYKPLGIARERNGMFNVSDILDTCRLHAKNLGYKLSAYGSGIGDTVSSEISGHVVRISESELNILMATILRANPELSQEQLLDRHCEGLGLNDDRYAHPILAMYIAMRHSPIAAIAIIGCMLNRIPSLIDLKTSRSMNPDAVLIDQDTENKINRIRLKIKQGLGLTPDERKFLDKHYRKEKPSWLLDAIHARNKQLTELSDTSIYRRYIPSATEKVAMSKPFKITKKYPEIAERLKNKRGKRV